MNNKLKNKQALTLIGVIIVVLILYFFAFFLTEKSNIFGNKKTVPPITKTPIEDVRKSGGDIYYYGQEKEEVIYDPSYSSPEEAEKYMKFLEENLREGGETEGQ